MAISRKTNEPTGVMNASGQPEIVLEIEGLTLSMTPPPRSASDGESQGAVPAADPAGDDR